MLMSINTYVYGLRQFAAEKGKITAPPPPPQEKITLSTLRPEEKEYTVYFVARFRFKRTECYKIAFAKLKTLLLPSYSPRTSCDDFE